MIVIIVQNRSTRVAANDAVNDEDNEAAAVDAMGVAPKNRLIILFITTFLFKCIATALSLLLIILITIVHALWYIIAWL